MDVRRTSLLIAESVDAWRIIPRAVLVLYSALVFNLYVWYKSIPTYIQQQCDSGVLRVLLDSGMIIEDAKSIACSVVDIVGGPTAAQSMFVTTIVGLSTGIFGLYVATGRKWERGVVNDVYQENPFDHHNHYGPPRNPGFGPPRFGPGSERPYGPGGDSSYGPGPKGPWGDSPSDTSSPGSPDR